MSAAGGDGQAVAATGQAVERCDNCGMPVRIIGVREPHYTHDHGSIFCMTDVAHVNGSAIPAASATEEGYDKLGGPFTFPAASSEQPRWIDDGLQMICVDHGEVDCVTCDAASPAPSPETEGGPK